MDNTLIIYLNSVKHTMEVMLKDYSVKLEKIIILEVVHSWLQLIENWNS